MSNLQHEQGLYRKRLQRAVKQINHALYNTKDEYEQALLLMQLGECQLKMGDIPEARTSLMISLEYFKVHHFRTELKKAVSLISALEVVE